MLVNMLIISILAAGCPGQPAGQGAAAEASPQGQAEEVSGVEAPAEDGGLLRLTGEEWEYIVMKVNGDIKGRDRVIDPKVIRMTLPEYPSSGPDSIPGGKYDVMLGLIVEADGKVSDVALIGDPLPAAIEKAAVEAAYSYEF